MPGAVLAKGAGATTCVSLDREDTCFPPQAGLLSFLGLYYILDTILQNQYVNTCVWLFFTVTNLSLFFLGSVCRAGDVYPRVSFNLDIQGSCSFVFGSYCCALWNLAALVTGELHIPLQHHKLCSKFEGMCCFALAAEPAEDIIQELKDYKSQPTSDALQEQGTLDSEHYMLICLFLFPYA